MNKKIFNIVISVFWLITFISCGPRLDEKLFKKHFDELHGYNVCGEISNIECLKKRQWTFEKNSIESIEKTFSDNISVSWLKRWEEFKSKFQPGDEVWYFRTPPETWKASMGTEGYMILRNGKAIAEIWTKIN